MGEFAGGPHLALFIQVEIATVGVFGYSLKKSSLNKAFYFFRFCLKTLFVRQNRLFYAKDFLERLGSGDHPFLDSFVACRGNHLFEIGQCQSGTSALVEVPCCQSSMLLYFRLELSNLCQIFSGFVVIFQEECIIKRKKKRQIPVPWAVREAVFQQLHQSWNHMGFPGEHGLGKVICVHIIRI